MIGMYTYHAFWRDWHLDREQHRLKQAAAEAKAAQKHEDWMLARLETRQRFISNLETQHTKAEKRFAEMQERLGYVVVVTKEEEATPANTGKDSSPPRRTTRKSATADSATAGATA